MRYFKGKYREFGKKIARSAKKIFARYGDGDGNFWYGMGVTVTVKKTKWGDGDGKKNHPKVGWGRGGKRGNFY